MRKFSRACFQYIPTFSGSSPIYNYFMVFPTGVLGAEMRGQLVLCRIESENSEKDLKAIVLIAFVFEVGLEESDQ